MLRGFNPWQRRITALGSLGLVLALLGFIGPWYIVVGLGFAVAILCIFALTLLGNRQNWRQLKGLDKRLNKLAVRNQPRAAPKPNTPSPQIPNVGVLYEYAKRIRKSHNHYEVFALMSKSLKIRDAFALAATRNKFAYDELSLFVAVRCLDMLPSVKGSDFKHWDRRALLAIARLEANQRTNESDLENAIRMFAFTEAIFGANALSSNDQLIYLEALGELGRFEQQSTDIQRFGISTSLPVQVELIALNAVQATEGATNPYWLQRLNNIYLERGFTPIEMVDSNDSKPLDRLTSPAGGTANGPLVSVIIPTFRGGPLLMTALRSLLNQTWANLEIIVVDDASGSEYEDDLQNAAALSSKIRVIRQAENLGAYCARNAGVVNANGEYITVHDDDDWSHGSKIETQVRHLINNPNVPGNMSAHTRVTDTLKFLRINNNPILTQANFSSLMVHKSVFQKIGLWDTVNRGADSEFRTRIKMYFGQPVQILDSIALSFTRTREGSLTSGELSRGYLEPARALYSKAYTQWHKTIGDDVELLKPGNHRNFPVPTTMQAGKRNENLGAFDLVFMTDFRFPGGTTSLTLAEIRASSEAGYRVGFLQADSPLNRANAPVSQDLFDMQLEGIVEQVSLQDEANIQLLVVRHPSVVTFMDQVQSKLTVRTAVLIVNNPPMLLGGTGMVFDLGDSIENMDRIFGSHTSVVAESGVTKALTQGLVPRDRLLGMTWPGLIPTVGEERGPDFDRLPVVGRHSRDHTLKWPTTKSEFNDAYTSARYETRFLGGVDKLSSKLGSDVLQDKTVFDFGEIPVEDFLDSLDFWVYFHDKSLTESFGMAIAEAMASGKVVILPPYLEASFGKGALYAEPSEVESLVTDLWTTPTRYIEQSRQAREYVAKHLSVEAFLSRVASLTESQVMRAS